MKVQGLRPWTSLEAIVLRSDVVRWLGGCRRDYSVPGSGLGGVVV